MQKEEEDIELSEEETQWLPYLRAEDFKAEEKEGLTLKYFDNNGEGKKPEKAYDTDAGLDLYYLGKEPLSVPAGKITAVDTQVAIEIPKNSYAQISTRSSWAAKGIYTVGGVCDAGYTGNIIVQLENRSDKDFTVQRNDKIAQLIFLPILQIDCLKRVETREQLGKSR
jgi:dUTP diphosphatase